MVSEKIVAPATKRHRGAARAVVQGAPPAAVALRDDRERGAGDEARDAGQRVEREHEPVAVEDEAEVVPGALARRRPHERVGHAEQRDDPGGGEEQDRHAEAAEHPRADGGQRPRAPAPQRGLRVRPAADEGELLGAHHPDGIGRSRPGLQPAGTPVAAIRHGQSPVPSSTSVQCSVKLRSAERLPDEDRGGVAVLDVAAAGHVELDRDRRRLRAGVEAGDPDRVDPRAADDEPRLPARVAGVQQLGERVRPRGRLQRRVVAVDRLRPGVDGAPHRRLDQVGVEAPVGEREIERGRARGAVEVEVGELGDGEARRGRRRRSRARRPRPRAAAARRPTAS